MAFKTARPQQARYAFESRSLEAGAENGNPGHSRRFAKIAGVVSFHNERAPVLAQLGVG